MRVTDVAATAQAAGNHGVRARFQFAREHLALAQKPGDGVPAYTRWVNRRAARLAAAVAFALRVTPNGVTVASLVASLLGMALLAAAPISGPTAWFVAAAFALAYLLDSADGQVARLSGRASKAGEWLDHVVDAVRTPATHVVVAVAWVTSFGGWGVLSFAALLMSVLLAGQFMSQILAEQLLRRAGREQRRGGVLRSWILLPTDPGAWAWIFVTWQWPTIFMWGYLLLTTINLIHIIWSMRRRYVDLRSADLDLQHRAQGGGA
ncbi:CDP-alcohol phosphatidyltransferase family protein [Ornithinicoccus hortensis]|uniref:CDP-alcohol phosphatidyltransferase-like enzyme n=1 Tax=Ornithinicoccus hortensis TaxID=82346 RepID=A0A542YLP7_9MICO|nr:CDP-alcohol phosphatidyltransferase-like enzyme [Ornithinicoccus hortensis]